MTLRSTKPCCTMTRTAASGSSLRLGSTAVRVEKTWLVPGLGIQQASEIQLSKQGQMAGYSANVNFEDHLPPLIV